MQVNPNVYTLSVSVVILLSLPHTMGNRSEAMTWPLVIPKNADEPTATTVFLRFCQTLRFSLFLMRSEG